MSKKIKPAVKEELKELSDLILSLGPVALNSLQYFMAWELKNEDLWNLNPEKRERLKQYILTLPPYNQK